MQPFRNPARFGDIVDEDGVELASLEAARSLAVTTIQALAATLRREGISIIDQALFIRDEDGQVLDAIFFRDVVFQS